jgi:hypothetical protein
MLEQIIGFLTLDFKEQKYGIQLKNTSKELRYLVSLAHKRIEK